MNTHRRKTPKTAGALLAAAIVLAGTTTVAANENRDKSQANADNKSHNTTTAAARDTAKIRIAPNDLDQRTAEHITGQNVRGSAGNLIGEVADVIVDCQSGKIAFFVVSRGGVAGIGDTLRLVPYGAMSRATNDQGFTTSVTEAQWEKMPLINEQDFEAGRINITADQQRQLADTRGNGSTATDSNESAYRGDFGQRLARAAKLRGLDVRANNQEVGEIEDIVLDLERGTATALMDADDDFARADSNFLVPLNQFQFTADRDALTTTLAATDFSSARVGDRDTVADAITQTTSDRVAAEQRSPNAAGNRETTNTRTQTSGTDEQLTPTGRTESADANANAAPALQSAARSIRQIWDAHPDLAKLDLRVTAENGKLIFRGTVPNTDLWERAKDTAEGVVRGVEIENHISIGNRAR